MSELISIWKNSDLTGAALPPPFSIPNNPTAHSIQINNQSRYWLILSKQQTGQDVLRMEPFSYQTMPTVPDLQVRIDTDLKNTISSLTADNEFVDYSSIEGVIAYQKGSTQFSGESTVNVSQAQVTLNATNVTINNGGTFTLLDSSGTIAAASVSQTVLAANATRKYLLFQNMSDTDMFISLTGTAVVNGAGSLWIQGGGGSMVFEDNVIAGNALSVICRTSGKSYTCYYV